MSENKIVAASIVNFLKQQLEGSELNNDSRESVEVGVQCIQTAFELSPEELTQGIDLLQLVRQQRNVANASRVEAERLKNEGNELMKAEKYREAFEKYTRAIELDPRNAVYFSNRAASHFKLGDNEGAIADCMAALAINPNYGKAHGRLGLAMTALDRHREAQAAFARAAQLEPDNESYKENLRLAEEKVAQSGQRGPIDFGGLLQHPALLELATEMLSDPNMPNVIFELMNAMNTSRTDNGGAVGMNALLETGQALAQHMQAVNPDLVEQLRRQVRPPGQGDNQPPPQ